MDEYRHSTIVFVTESNTGWEAPRLSKKVLEDIRGSVVIIKERYREGVAREGVFLNEPLKHRFVDLLERKFADNMIYIHEHFFSVSRELLCAQKEIPLTEAPAMMINDMSQQLLGYSRILKKRPPSAAKPAYYYSGKETGDNDDIISAWILVEFAREAFSVDEKYAMHRNDKYL